MKTASTLIAIKKDKYWRKKEIRSGPFGLLNPPWWLRTCGALVKLFHKKQQWTLHPSELIGLTLSPFFFLSLSSSLDIYSENTGGSTGIHEHIIISFFTAFKIKWLERYYINTPSTTLTPTTSIHIYNMVSGPSNHMSSKKSILRVVNNNQIDMLLTIWYTVGNITTKQLYITLSTQNINEWIIFDKHD